MSFKYASKTRIKPMNVTSTNVKKINLIHLSYYQIKCTEELNHNFRRIFNVAFMNMHENSNRKLGFKLHI